MPLYEYECQNCKERFTILIRGAEDKKNAACPKCASHNITKLFSPFSTGSFVDERSNPPPGPCSCGGPC